MTLRPTQPSASERRKFSRVLFDAKVYLVQGERHWHTQLADISLKGALVPEPLAEGFDPALPLQLNVELADNTLITMQVQVAHQQRQQLGLVCTSIDIDSVCHLRRLLELNLGDAQAAERELSELIHAD